MLVTVDCLSRFLGDDLNILVVKNVDRSKGHLYPLYHVSLRSTVIGFLS